MNPNLKKKVFLFRLENASCRINAICNLSFYNVNHKEILMFKKAIFWCTKNRALLIIKKFCFNTFSYMDFVLI